MKRVLSQAEIPADVIEKSEAWQAKRRDFDPTADAATLYAIFQAVQAVPDAAWHERNSLQSILLRHPKGGSGLILQSQPDRRLSLSAGSRRP
jgi:elongator complex protein 3